MMSESDKPTEKPGEKPDESSAEAKPGAAAPSEGNAGAGRKGRGKTARQPAQHPRERRGLLILALVALILALVALAGVGALGWSWYQMRGQQTRITQLADRVSELGGQTQALEHTKADAAKIATLSEQLHENKRTMQARLDAIGNSLRALNAHLSGANTAYREDEAGALMRLAQARASLAHDPAGAERALKLAQKTLDRTGDPALEPVSLALQREIAALEAVPRVDTSKLYPQLEALAEQAGQLPLAGQAMSKPLAPATQSSGFSWHGLGAAFKRAFSPLIVVRHGQKARPLLPPSEAWFLRRNLRLTLADAQLALLQRNGTAWHASLAQARSWLENWYLTSDAGVKQALSRLETLSSTPVAPALPRLGAALAKLTQVQAQRHSQPPAPGTATSGTAGTAGTQPQ